ncbi:MAG TPA: hypothetical protein VFA89_13480 [Terriglobales bacterium]|nr:hypothetical protein [Terriglobales bacterium]
MADLSYPSASGLRARTDWGAIWAGMFTFVAIWSVFGLLGFSIFASAANPNAARPVTGMGWGMGIWAIVLTIIAMYVAGRETGRLAAVTNKHDGAIHGMIMFGLAVVATLLITTIAGAALSGGSGVEGQVHNPYLLDVFTGLGWAGFLSLFLGWLAAMGGASSGVAARAANVPLASSNLRDIRPAA